MQVTASAPGKAILFGEHSVVYGKPAIALAVNKKAQVQLEPKEGDDVRVEINPLNLRATLDPHTGTIETDNSPKQGILRYILASLQELNLTEGVDVNIDLELPIGSGLGSSAAITVATIAALATYMQIDLGKEEIAKLAHQTELKVQGAASPLDTLMAAKGGIRYLAKNAEENRRIKLSSDLPLLVAHIPRKTNTGILAKEVRLRRDSFPEIINPIFEVMEQVTEQAYKILHKDEVSSLGDLMNINQGLLDALGVNTRKLSDLIYTAREAGAKGSKITGAGGGGSILVYCPDTLGEVYHKLKSRAQVFPVEICEEGVKTELIP